MPTRLVQLPRHPAGKAVLQVAGPAQAVLPIPESLEIAVVQVGAVDRYLHPQTPDDAWRSAVFRFRPVSATREGELLSIEIDEWITYHLRPSQPYKLLIRQVEGLEIEERFTGPATMRRIVGMPIGWVQSSVAPAAVPVAAPPAVREPVAAPAPPVETPPVQAPPPPPPPDPPPQPLPNLPVAPPPPPPVEAESLASPAAAPPPSRRGMLWGSVAVLLVAAGAAAWYFTRDRGAAAPVIASAASAPPAAPKSLDSLGAVREFLSQSPTPEQALQQANALAAGSRLLDGQLLLYKSAGERGNAEAARRMGFFYDPDTWAADKSPLPAANPMEATRWYKQGAEAGDAESQYRFGMLLKQGRTDVADGPEQAVLWFRKAAEQGHADAKKALGN